MADQTLTKELIDNAQEGTSSAARKIVIDELLCYVSYHMMSCTPDNIKKIVINHFSNENIDEAKKLLWKECCEEKAIDYHVRKTTPSRSKAEANISDICDAFIQLDRLYDGQLPVTFVASDLSKLPRHSPEELNEVSILSRVRALENKFNLIESSVSSNHIEIESIKESTSKYHQTVDTHGQLLSEISQSIDTSVKSHSQPSRKPQANTRSASSSSSDYSDTESDSDEMSVETANRLRRQSPAEASGKAPVVQKQLVFHTQWDCHLWWSRRGRCSSSSSLVQ